MRQRLPPTLQHSLHRLTLGHSLLPVELRGKADLRIGHTLRAQQLRQLPGNAGQRRRVLHDPKGEVKALQILVDAAAVLRGAKIRPVALQGVCRHGDPCCAAQLPNRLRQERAVQMQVQLHLGKVPVVHRKPLSFLPGGQIRRGLFFS